MSDPEYRRFLAKAAPQRFRIYDGATLVAGLRRLHRFRNDRLHAVMAIPASGVVMRQHTLPKLPQTRMLLMQDDKRLQPVEAYNDWVETQIQLDYIVDGAAEAAITVRR